MKADEQIGWFDEEGVIHMLDCTCSLVHNAEARPIYVDEFGLPTVPARALPEQPAPSIQEPEQ